MGVTARACCANRIALSFEGGIAWNSFLENNFADFSDVVRVKKKNQDFVQPLVAFPISNISYYIITMQASLLARCDYHPDWNMQSSSQLRVHDFTSAYSYIIFMSDLFRNKLLFCFGLFFSRSNKTLYSHVSLIPLPNDYVPTTVALPGTSYHVNQGMALTVCLFLSPWPGYKPHCVWPLFHFG